MSQFAPCPKCKASNAEKISFTWWGGLLGPKILKHVKCLSCGTKYNGKTGRDNTTGIIIYSLVVGVAVFFLMLVLFAVAGLLLYSSSSPR
jgi:uncharacterized protein (DUF983 family)